MNPSVKKDLKKRLGEIVQGIARLDSLTDMVASNDAGIRWFDSGLFFSISGSTFENHNKLISRLLKIEGWAEKLSEKFLNDQLLAIYTAHFANPSSDKFCEGLNKIQSIYDGCTNEVVVLVPLAGIEMTIEAITIGKILFRRMNENEFSKLMAGNVLDPSSTAIQKHIQILFRGRTNVVLAEYRVVAMRSRAEERAFDECRRVLDVLRYAQSVLSNMTSVVDFGFDHEPASRERLFTYAYEDGATKGLIPGARDVGGFELKITDQANILLEQVGALKVTRVLEKKISEITEFEEMVLRALRWYSSAVKTAEAENKFLNYVTCLETFFTPTNRDPISNAIAEGCAFILGGDVDSRKNVFRRIKELYGARSGLSHGGKTAILESEINEMESISWHLLFWMISKLGEFTNRKSLQEWLEEQKFK